MNIWTIFFLNRWVAVFYSLNGAIHKTPIFCKNQENSQNILHKTSERSTSVITYQLCISFTLYPSCQLGNICLCIYIHFFPHPPTPSHLTPSYNVPDFATRWKYFQKKIIKTDKRLCHRRLPFYSLTSAGIPHLYKYFLMLAK